jgi:hypothetical protein
MTNLDAWAMAVRKARGHFRFGSEARAFFLEWWCVFGVIET